MQIREDNQQLKNTCHGDFHLYEALEKSEEDLNMKIISLKNEINLKSSEVQLLREKIHKLIDNLTSMASVTTNGQPTAKHNFMKLTQLQDRLHDHNLI